MLISIDVIIFHWNQNMVMSNPLKTMLAKCYLRILSVPQREHHTSPLQRSTG
jgi:hypothetical protein